MSTELQHDTSELFNFRKVDSIEIADFRGVPVVVEHKQIEASWTEKRGKRLLQRVIRLAGELSKAPIPRFRTLRCLGFCFNMRQLSFDFFFKIPETSRDTSLRRLGSVLGHSLYKPLLNHRLHLALSLAQSYHPIPQSELAA
jgi:hypothetical protein